MSKAKADRKPDFKRTKQYKELKIAMEKNLESRGLTGPIYDVRVHRYLTLLEMEYMADLDIKERGLNVLDEKRGTMTVNPSVSTRLNASREAEKICKALGYNAESSRQQASGVDDGDEL